MHTLTTSESVNFFNDHLTTTGYPIGPNAKTQYNLLTVAFLDLQECEDSPNTVTHYPYVTLTPDEEKMELKEKEERHTKAYEIYNQFSELPLIKKLEVLTYCTNYVDHNYHPKVAPPCIDALAYFYPNNLITCVKQLKKKGATPQQLTSLMNEANSFYPLRIMIHNHPVAFSELIVHLDTRWMTDIEVLGLMAQKLPEEFFKLIAHFEHLEFTDDQYLELLRTIAENHPERLLEFIVHLENLEFRGAQHLELLIQTDIKNLGSWKTDNRLGDDFRNTLYLEQIAPQLFNRNVAELTLDTLNYLTSSKGEGREKLIEALQKHNFTREQLVKINNPESAIGFIVNFDPKSRKPNVGQTDAFKTIISQALRTGSRPAETHSDEGHRQRSASAPEKLERKEQLTQMDNTAPPEGYVWFEEVITDESLIAQTAQEGDISEELANNGLFSRSRSASAPAKLETAKNKQESPTMTNS